MARLKKMKFNGTEARILRRALGLTKKDVEVKTGIPANTLKAWETTHRNPKLDGLQKLGKLYGYEFY